MTDKSHSEALAEWNRLKPLFNAWWVTAWGVLVVIFGGVYVCRAPLNWQSWALLYVGFGMIYLGVRGRQSILKELKQNENHSK